jgi:hypothetical protein
MKNDEWITVNEAANISGYNEEHITRLIREEKITAQKFSIVWQVSRASLLAYIEKIGKLGNKRGPKSKL